MGWKELDPGMYEGVPEADYRALDAASQSRLKVLQDRTPAHLRWELDHPPVPTDAMRLGRALHDAVLLPDVFAETYCVAGPCAATTAKGAPCSNAGSVRVGGRWLCGIHARGLLPDTGLEVLSAREWAQCLGCRASVAGHPTAMALLEGAQTEVSVLWTDEPTGVRCKARWDALFADHSVIVDIKTTEDASRAAFSRTIYTYRYYVQAAWYLDAARANGIPATMFAIVAVEKTAPYALQVYEIHSEAVDAGRQEVDALLAIYAECLRAGVWPSYPKDPVAITLPPWAWQDIERQAVARMDLVAEQATTT